MRTKEIIKSQYLAALEMLRQAMVECPESIWFDAEYTKPVWHIVFHVLFYTHFYLLPCEDDFSPWEKHRDEFTSLGTPEENLEKGKAYTRAELLEYHDLCCEQVEEQVNSMDLEAESGFYWLPFDKLELQIYNIRHVQQHAGELFERLGQVLEVELNWVGMKPD